MLYDIEYYYQKSLETTGVESMDCKMQACIVYYIITCVRYWPEVKTYGDYIRKCYSIAKEVPVDELRNEYIRIKFRNKITLNMFLHKVENVLHELNIKNLNDGSFGYTPITHIQEQLIHLENEVRAEIKSRKFW